ncbi:MAG: carbohydrate ABC transporter permease [Chloroflexi bacterium]|nr:MAG: carbohydrate ABC transporter permease [Chloroflexota bacterium]
MSTRIRPVWMEEPTPPEKVLKAGAIVLVLLAVLFPLYVVVLTSISTQASVAAAGGLVIVPHGITFGAYTDLFSGGVVTRSVIVSTGITLVGTALSVAVTVMAAYGLSRPSSFAHRPLLFVILLTFLASLILPGAVAAFNVVVVRSFFMNSIPQDLIDSARLDGASEFRILREIVLPLSRAVTAVIALFYGVGYWNAFFNALLYLNDNGKWPLQLVLRAYVLQGQPIPGVNSVQQAAANSLTGAAPTLAIKMAVITLAVIPVLIVYPFVQRHFTKGVIIGAVKG